MKSKPLFLLLLLHILFLTAANAQINAWEGFSQSEKQNTDTAYIAQWQKADSLENINMLQSADSIVKEIYQQAWQQENYPSAIKALLFELKYQNALNDVGIWRQLQRLDAEIEKMPAPHKNVLQSIAGSVWLTAYNNNNYDDGQLEPDTADPTTWDVDKILKKAESYFVASVQNQHILLQIPIQNYTALTFVPENASNLWPTLYDLLQWRAFKFYSKQTEIDYENILDFDEDIVYCDVSEFPFLSFSGNTAQNKALRSLQNLLHRYSKSGQITALVMADLERVNYLRKITSNAENKDSLEVVWLEAQLQKYAQHPVAAHLLFTIATKISCTSTYTGKKNLSALCNNTQALHYCQWAIDSFPNEPASKNCLALMDEIHKPYLNITTENTVAAKTPFRYSLRYKNINQVFVKFIAIDEDTLDKLEASYTSISGKKESFMQQLLSYPSVANQTVSLPDNGKFIVNSTEWYHTGLPQGHYVMLVSADANFSTDSNITMYQRFWSSDYVIYASKTDNNKYAYFIAQSKDNSPIKGARVVVSYYSFNEDYTEEYKVLLDAITDKNGIVTVDIDESKSVKAAVFLKGKKVLSSRGSYYLSSYDRNRDYTNTNTYFYTDRSIYRPGQTLFFKGIMVQSSTKADAQLLQNQTTTIILEDANGETVATQEFTTNSFGSFSGSFVLPYGRLTGYFSLRDKFGSESFLVEEYKRPKFEVIFDTLKSNPSFNDTVVVNGKAKAFAGNALNGATLVYAVSRQLNYQYFRWDKYYTEEDESAIIKTDTVLLNDDGTFTFSFVALAGKNPNNNYTYRIAASVTDITGESQTGEQSISIGKRTVYVSLNAIDETFAPTSVPIHLMAKNLNNRPVPLQGTVSIKALQTPKTIFTDNYFELPDTQIIDPETFKKLFPHTAFNEENIRENYPVEAIVFTQKIDQQTGEETIEWQTEKQASGLYLIEFEYTDNLGEKHTEKRYLALLNTNNKKAFEHKDFVLVADKPNYQPNQTATVTLSSRFPKTRIIYFIERQGKVGAMQQVKLNNGQYSIQIPIKEVDRGGIHITAFTVYNNRFYKEHITLNIPYSNKELNVEISSFRDKMMPGDKEEWQLKISGEGAKAVSAEILASMYDESLDKIYGGGWGDFTKNYQPYWYSAISPEQYTQGSNSLSLISFYLPSKHYLYRQKYPRLYFFKWMPDLLYQSIYNWKNDYYDYENDVLLGLQNSGGSGGGGAGGGFGSGHGRGASAMGFRDSRKDISANALSLSAANDEVQEKSTENNSNAGLSESASMNLQGFSPAQFIKVRRNLDETAFFFAHQQTDDSGNVIIKFIAPEALTCWKFRAYAHTQDLSSGYVDVSSITQKPLMVQTNMPRFLREGDEIYINAKIVNLSDNELSPNAVLEIYDAATGKNLPEFNNTNMVQVPQLAAGVSQSIKWKFKVPTGYGALKIIVKTFEGKFTDAEANTIPVLSNKVLVTEALPITFSGSSTKTFTLDKLAKSGSSNTLNNHKLTFEYTANPAWYAIQALPYMMEYPNECAEQVFNRYYANTIAQYIANDRPKIREVFDSWKNAAEQGKENSLQSALENNEELKSLLLQETPWLAEGKTETERKKRIGLLFDDNYMENQRQMALTKLMAMQLPNGSFPWFAGMRENLTITQYIVAGLGKLNLFTEQENSGTDELLSSLSYMHAQAENAYKKVKDKANSNHLSFSHAQYLYAISFYIETDAENRENYKESLNFWKKQAADYWAKGSLMEQAMIAIALHRLGDENTPSIIIKSFEQTAIKNAENGMHWKERSEGFNWTDAPIETQALLIEAFDLITDDDATINQMRTWLLKQKQLSDWKTTRATADACYALLLKGDYLLEDGALPTITLGNQTINTDPEIEAEAGTGYVKKSFNKEEIAPSMGKATISPQDDTNVPMAWGGLYWQYFEQLDKITYAQTPLSLVKQLFVEQTTDNKTTLQPLREQKLKAGDKITVRILLKVNNDMDFVHLKDMRAAALEPTQNLSGYQWQNGVGYYQSIRDASMDFFFDKLPKGQWVFEYSLRVSQAGTFQNGIATIQSMYAPQYTSHSDGVVIEVKP